MISEKYLNHFVAISLVLVISFAVYSNSLRNNFVNYDDDWLVLENKKIRSLDLKSIYLMFSEATESDYLPLKELSYAVDYYFWEFNPFGYHLTNIVLFMINCLLVYLLVFKLFENKLFAFFSCLLFALHPVHSEAVNWISSRKDLLSGVFFFLSSLLYVYSSNGNFVFYFFSMLSFIFALFSKPSVITFPLLLPLFEYCFLAEKKPIKAEKIILRVIPFFIIALVLTAITLSVASEKEVVKTYWGNSPYITFTAMLGIFFDYIKLLFFPINLNVRYEVPFPPSFSDMRIIAGAILLTAFFIICYKFRKNNKLALFCLMWFLITLIPVSNLIPIAILKADRYIYLPSFAFTLLLSSVVYKTLCRDNLYGFHAKSSSLKGEGGLRVIIFFLIISSLYFALTINRNAVWKDSLTLWNDTIKKSPGDSLVYNNLGTIYLEKENPDKAIFYFRKAIEISPGYSDPHFNLSVLYNKRREYREALNEIKSVLDINPNDFKAYMSLGNTYKRTGDFDKAVDAYKKAIDINEKSGEPHYNLAILLNSAGLTDNAIEEYKKAIALDATLTMAYNNLGNIYFKRGLIKEAAQEYKQAVRQDPKNYAVNNNLGNALNEAGKYDEAIKYLKIAAGLRKNEIIPHLNLGKIYMGKDMFNDAIDEFEKVLKLNPNEYEAHSNLGEIFLKLGDKEKAAEHFKKSLSLNPKDRKSENFLKKINSSGK